MIRPFALFSVVTILTGCVPESSTSPSAGAVEAADQVATRNEVLEPTTSVRSRPSAQQLVRPEMPIATSWREQLSGLPQVEAQYLHDKNASYFGALAYSSAEERELLKRIGIPSPEDFLAARRLTLEELKSGADTGGVQARLLYIDRLIDEAQRKTTSETGIAGEEAAALAARASFEIGKLKGRSNSAFIPYLDARLFTTGSTPKPEYVTGAMLAALDRGDTRAIGLLEPYARESPNVDALAVAMYFATMKANENMRP